MALPVVRRAQMHVSLGVLIDRENGTQEPPKQE